MLVSVGREWNAEALIQIYWAGDFEGPKIEAEGRQPAGGGGSWGGGSEPTRTSYGVWGAL